MTYFLAAGGTVDVNALRSSADTLSSGSISGVFTQDGSYFYRVDNPLIGEQFGFLSDVSIADFGGGFAALQNVTQLNGIQVFQVARNPNGTFGINASAGSTNSALDAVLGARYPSYMNNSIYETFTMGAGQSSSAYLPEFYIRVTGSANAFDPVYGQLGFNAPDDGRFLVTRGQIGGQRDAAWGNWLDVVTQGSTPPTTPPVTPPVTPPITPPLTPPSSPNPITELEAAQALNAINTERVQARLNLEDVRFELGIQRERLDALGQQAFDDNVVISLQTLATAGAYAKVVLAFATPTGTLASTVGRRIDANTVGSGAEALGAVAALFHDGMTAAEFGHALSSVGRFVGNAGQFPVLRQFAATVDAVRASSAYNSDLENYFNNRLLINENVASTNARILELEQQERALETRIFGSAQSNPESPHATESFRFVSGQDRATLSGSAGVIIFEAGPTISLPDNATAVPTAVMLLGSHQTVIAGRGNTIVDGTVAGSDHIVLYGNLSSYALLGAPEAAMVFERSDRSIIAIEVDRVHFDDAIIALDTQGNAGDAYRIYQAAFDRTPDRPGLSYWVNQMDDGMALSQVALNFILSPEFTATYGNINAMSNAQFVTVLYENVLHRAPDQAGLNYWLNDLANGNVRHAVLAAFSESAENQANVSVQLLHGINLDPHAFI